jgi:hypothetical protein
MKKSKYYLDSIDGLHNGDNTYVQAIVQEE